MARAAFVFSLLLASVCNATAQGEVAAACRATDLVVRQRATGRVVEGKPEYAVEVANRCRCAQSRVLLRCYGLSSVESDLSLNRASAVDTILGRTSNNYKGHEVLKK
uniref:Bifunctional inhibitor/plant lipid transfer protein/seed storage helical domain-containing protein n=1 Tax=Oryza brachyantha TaxID=4533 RepID=J3LD64_ORYBR